MGSLLTRDRSILTGEKYPQKILIILRNTLNERKSVNCSKQGCASKYSFPRLALTVETSSQIIIAYILLNLPWYLYWHDWVTLISQPCWVEMDCSAPTLVCFCGKSQNLTFCVKLLEKSLNLSCKVRILRFQNSHVHLSWCNENILHPCGH